MEITLYKNKSGNNVVSKTLVDDKDYNDVVLKENTTLEKPTLIIGGLGLASLYKYNYLYIPNFHRYYFIDDRIAMTGKRIQLNCRVDVLMSFKDDILKSKQLVVRQEKKKNLMIQDSMLPLHGNSKYEMKNFGNALNPNSNKYYIAIQGGA